MKAAIIEAQGADPVFGDFEDPSPGPDEHLITVGASAISPLTRGRASGAHYSSSGRYPFVAGVDGVGRTEAGERVYFVLPRAPHGGMAERSVAARTHCVPVPPAVDDSLAAAIANPGMSSAAALAERAGLKVGETVLINGATGASGRLAVRIARHMGAARVIVSGRDQSTLDALTALGADETIVLGTDETLLDRRFAETIAQGVDVVLDYLWGDSARRLLTTAAKILPEGKPLRFVQIGNSSGAEIALPGAALRSAAITLLGSGLGSVPLPRLLSAITTTFAIAAAGGLDLPIRTMPLADVRAAWSLSGRERIVLAAR